VQEEYIYKYIYNKRIQVHTTIYYKAYDHMIYDYMPYNINLIFCTLQLFLNIQVIG